MYYIFYKTNDGGSDPTGAHFYQDISSYSLQQGDDIYIEWSLGVPNFADNQLPLTDSNGNTMTWGAATYPNTKIKVFVYGGDDGTGTAYGTLITHGEMLSYLGGSTVNFFDEQYTFNRTLGSGTGAVTTTDATRFNTIRFVVTSIVDGETFYIDDVDFGFTSFTTSNWAFNSDVINSNGTLVFNDGGEAVQTGSNLIEAGKTYTITCSPLNPVGIPRLTVNGMLVSSFPQDITFPSSSNNVTLLVLDGGLSLPSITIQEIEPYGGNVDCWDLNGADSDFLYTSQSGSGGSIVFDEAPEDTYLRQPLINTNQILDFTDGTNCNVSFNITNYTGSGELMFVLYNDEGEGFEHTISSNGSYSFSNTIGNDSSTTLTSIFGFLVSSTNTFSGEVDNVNIVLDSNNSGKTISFNEKSKGWTSLKSFIPEFAISSVNQYYTMNFGQLWKHHQEFELDGTTPVDRNTFYDVFEDSSVTPVLNTQPEVVKNFNTLNYEGSQSRVDLFATDPTTGLTDGQYYNLEAKPGWYVEDVHTDKQEGTLNEFIEKEGKWFNYIKGRSGQVDTAAFNFQGLGIVETVDVLLPPPVVLNGCMNPNALNYFPGATVDNGSCIFLPGAFEMQIRNMTSMSSVDGAARVVYTGTNIEATGFTYAWSNGNTASETTGLGMGPMGLTLTDDMNVTHVVNHPTIPQNFVFANTVNGCTNPNATNFNYEANTDDGTCTI